MEDDIYAKYKSLNGGFSFFLGFFSTKNQHQTKINRKCRGKREEEEEGGMD